MLLLTSWPALRYHLLITPAAVHCLLPLSTVWTGIARPEHDQGLWHLGSGLHPLFSAHGAYSLPVCFRVPHLSVHSSSLWPLWAIAVPCHFACSSQRPHRCSLAACALGAPWCWREGWGEWLCGSEGPPLLHGIVHVLWILRIHWYDVPYCKVFDSCLPM